MMLCRSALLYALVLGVVGCIGSEDPKDVDSPPCVGFGCDPDTDSEVDSPEDSEVDSPVDTEVDSPVDTEVDSPVDTEVVDSEIDSPLQDTMDSAPDTEIRGPTGPVDSDSDSAPTDPPDTHTGVVDTIDSVPIVRPDGIDTLLPGDFVLTEFLAQPTSPGCTAAGEYIEILNVSGREIAIDGLIVRIDSRDDVVSSAVVLAAGEYAVGQRQVLGAPCNLGITPDFTYSGPILSNSGGVISIENGAGAIDTVDYGGWMVLPGHSTQLLAGSEDATSNDDESNWCDAEALLPAGTDRGSPGVQASSCYVPPIDTDTGPTDPPLHTDTAPVADTVDTELPDDGILYPHELQPGDLRIVEMNLVPTDCNSPRFGRYFELYNTADQPVYLDEATFDWGGFTNIRINYNSNSGEDGLIQPGEVVAVSFRNLAIPCYGFTREFEFTNELTSFPQALTLRIGPVVVDSVDFSQFSFPPGRALGFDPSLFSTPDLNVDPLNWCPQRSLIGSGTDQGTPNQDNDACLIPDSLRGHSDTFHTGDTDETGIPGRDPSDGLDAEELIPGELIITEVMIDPLDCGGNEQTTQYIELYNNTAYEIRVEDLFIEVPGRPGRRVEPTSITIPLQPGEYTIVARRTLFPYCYAFGRDYEMQTGEFVYGAYRIYNSTRTIDEIDLTGFATLPGYAVQLDPDAGFSLAANDDIDNWCYADPFMFGGIQDHGTPYEANVCADIVIVDTDTDTGPEPVDTSIPATDLESGDLIITEIMFDGTDCSRGATTQYVEVFNNAGRAVSLSGLTMDFPGSPSNSALEITPGSDPLPAGAYAAIRRSTSFAFCYGLNDEYEVSTGGDLLPGLYSLRAGPVIVDRVNLGAIVPEPGRALQLDPAIAILDHSSNDNVNDWCVGGPTLVTGGYDRGTPNAENVCGITVPQDTDDTAPEFIPDYFVEDLRPGDLIITELMEEPGPGCTTQAKGEYIEVFNRTGGDVDLSGLELEINGSVHAITSLQVRAGTYFTLARTDNNRCYDFTASYLYPGNNSFALDDAGNVIILRVPTSAGGPLAVDVVDSFTFPPAQRGVARQLDRNFRTANANDDERYWCSTAIDPQHDLDAGGPIDEYGTPNDVNLECPRDTGDFIFDSFGFETFVVDDTFKPLSHIVPGDLIITEFLSIPRACGGDASAEYIEIHNTTSTPINLAGMLIEDSDSRFEWSIQSPIEAGGYALLSNFGTERNCHGFVADLLYQADPLDDIGDLIRLSTLDGQLIDEVDFRGWPLVLGHAWELDPASYDVDANDDVDVWCPGQDPILSSPDFGTPRSVNTACDTDDDPVGAVDLVTLVPGDLVITEMMVDPREPGCTDGDAEYFEVLNTTLDPVNLEGLSITNRWFDQLEVLVADDVVIGPAERAMFGRFSATPCYDVVPEVTYPALRWRERGDLIRLSVGATVLDEVDFRSGWPIPPDAAAWELSSDATDASSNDDPEVWCASLELVAGATVDRGTPGDDNGFCYDDDGSVDGETGWVVPDTEWFLDTDPSSADLGGLIPGDLLITEIMADPYDCTDAEGEYLEIINLSGGLIDLDGLVITVTSATGTTAVTVSGTNLVGDEDFVVIGGGRRALCSGAPVDIHATLPLLPNGGASISVGYSSTVFDAVDYGTFGAVPVGASWSLSPDLLDHLANDVGDAWCVATTRIPGAAVDRGTPGGENQACSRTTTSDTGGCLETGDLDACLDYIKPLRDVAIGELLISEFFVDPRDCDDNAAEFVEVYNNTTDWMDLNGLEIGGGGVLYPYSQPSPLLLPPGGFAAITRSAARPCYESFDPLYSYRVLRIGVAPQVLFLSDGDRVLDLVDFAGFAPIPGRSWGVDVARLGTVTGSGGDVPSDAVTGLYTGSYANNDAAAWCPQYTRIQGATGDRATPGTINDPACLRPGETPPYPPDYIAHVDQLDPGDLIVHEMMISSAACIDLRGEYLEIRNDAAFAVDLAGLAIGTVSGTNTILGGGVLQPGELALGRREGAASTSCYSGLIPDFEFLGGLADDGFVTLESSHTVLDFIDYSGWAVPEGSALQLRPGANGGSNGLENAWCSADVAFAGSSGDFGTPGSVTICSSASDTGTELLIVGDLLPGDLVITEFLPENTECAGSADNQYLEILNVTDTTVDLAGLRISNSTGFSDIAQSVLVAPGERVVGAFNGPFACSAFDRSFQHTTLLQPSDLLRLEVAGTIIDEVDFTTWNNTTGAAWQLDPQFEDDAVANDLESAWCDSDLFGIPGTQPGGTPAQPNECVIDTGGPIHTGITPEPIRVIEAVLSGTARVAPGAIYLGNQDRVIDDEDLALGTAAVETCHWRYTQNGVALANVAQSCPSCVFAFETIVNGGRDVLAASGQGPSDCTGLSGTNAFAAFGGTPSVVIGRRTIGFSPVYEAAIYGIGTAPVQVLTYDASFAPLQPGQPYNFQFRAVVEQLYYY